MVDTALCTLFNWEPARADMNVIDGKWVLFDAKGLHMTSYSKTCKSAKPFQQFWFEAAVTVSIWNS